MWFAVGILGLAALACLVWALVRSGPKIRERRRKSALGGRQEQTYGSATVRMGARLSPSRADRMLKEATSLKKEGDIDEAIRTLRKAYQSIASGRTIHSVSSFLRLPAYLQEAGRPDEAWQEFNSLLTRGYPNQPKNAAGRWMDHSTVYNKMRLFLQREKKPLEAVTFGVFSLVCEEVGLVLDRRSSERADRDYVEDYIARLMRKAKREADAPAIARLVWQALRKPRVIDLRELGRDLDQHLPPRPTSRAP